MGTKRQYHHGNLREALVEAAIREVEEKGVAALTLRGVARRAGVSQAAPYHHFASKEALVAELCLRGFSELNRRMREVIEATEDPNAQLVGIGRAYVHFALESPASFRVLFGHYVEDKAEYEELRCEAQNSFELLVGTIARGQRAGVFVGEDAVRTSLAVWSSVHGASMLLVDGALQYESMRKFGVAADVFVEATVEHTMRALRP